MGLRLTFPSLLLVLLPLLSEGAVSTVAGQGIEQTWPWEAWERSFAGLTRWPELDSESWKAWKQFDESDPDRQLAAVYLVPHPPDQRPAEKLSRIALPRLDNPVGRVWWWPWNAAAQANPATELRSSEPKLRLRDFEYGLPFVPPVDRLLKLTQTPLTWQVTLSPAAEQACEMGEGLVVIELLGEPRLGAEPERLNAGPDGAIVLPASKAKVSGSKLQFEPLPHKNTLGYWVDENDRARWRLRVPRPGTYRVSVLAGCGAGQGGSLVEVVVGDSALQMMVEETGHFQNFRRREIGEVELADRDDLAVELRCLRKAKAAVMDVRELRLTPVAAAESQMPRDVGKSTPDVTLPPLTHETPSAGKRTLVSYDQAGGGSVYHVLSLPIDWRPEGNYPVLVEWTGNGPYENRLGDRCSGRVEDAALAYGLTGGDGWIVLSLPFLNAAGTANVLSWWGDPPQHDPAATLRYAERVLSDVCQSWGGDRSRVVLVGFSRGSIAATALGLGDPQLSSWWAGLLCFSHLDGVRSWPPPATDPEGALAGWQRLGDRPWFVLAESSLPTDGEKRGATLLDQSKRLLESTGLALNVRFAETGFVNHSDRWTLCPNPARTEVREWLRQWTDIETKN